MNYSLYLLLEKSGFMPDQYRVSRSMENFRFEAVQLYPGSPQFCQADTVYLLQDCAEAYGEQPLPADCCLLLCLPDASAAESDAVSCPCGRLDCSVVLLFGVTWQEAYGRIGAALRELKRQYQRLADAVYQSAKLQDLMLMISDFLGNPGYIVDSSFKVLAIDTRNNMRELTATWRHLEDDGYLPYDLIAGLMENQELYQMEHFQEAHLVHSRHFYVPFINYNLRKKKKLTGHLFIAAIYRSITPGDIELLDGYGKLVELALNASIPYQQERGYHYEYFISDLMRGRISDRRYIQAQMRSLKFRDEAPMAVIVCAISARNELALERLRNQLERFRGGRPILLNSRIVSLIPLKQGDTEELLLEEMNRQAQRFDFQAGISEIFTGYSQIHLHYQQAERALQMLMEIPVSGRKTSLNLPGSCRGKKAVLYRDCALTQLLESFLQQSESNFYFCDCIQTLLEYDARRDTDFARTLLVYLEKERNIVQTAQTLHIHRNSLRYRIRKILALTGANLDDPQVRTRLYLSLLRHSLQ